MPLILQPVFNEQSRDEIEQHLMVVRARRMSAVAVYYAGVNAKTHQDLQQPRPRVIVEQIRIRCRLRCRRPAWCGSITTNTQWQPARSGVPSKFMPMPIAS
jgi:hypothetical protein